MDRYVWLWPFTVFWRSQGAKSLSNIVYIFSCFMWPGAKGWIILIQTTVEGDVSNQWYIHTGARYHGKIHRFHCRFRPKRNYSALFCFFVIINLVQRSTFLRLTQSEDTVKLVIRGHSTVHHQVSTVDKVSTYERLNYSHSTYQFFHFFKCFLLFIYIVTYSPSNVWFTFFSLIFALIVYKLRPSQTYFIKSTMTSPEEIARCPRMRR